MNTFYTIYLSLIASAFLLSCVTYKKGIKSSLYILLILLATFLVELFSRLHTRYSFQYYVFNLLEYSLFCIYYLKTCGNKRLKLFVRASIPLFILFGIYTGIVYQFKSLPALNINVEGFLLFILYTHLLFNLDEKKNLSIYFHPDFWISIGVLTFFGGVFVFFGLYPTLLHLDARSAFDMYDKITQPLNLILYTSIIIGFICILKKRSYFLIQ